MIKSEGPMRDIRDKDTQYQWHEMRTSNENRKKPKRKEKEKETVKNSEKAQRRKRANDKRAMTFPFHPMLINGRRKTERLFFARFGFKDERTAVLADVLLSSAHDLQSLIKSELYKASAAAQRERKKRT